MRAGGREPAAPARIAHGSGLQARRRPPRQGRAVQACGSAAQWRDTAGPCRGRGSPICGGRTGEEGGQGHAACLESFGLAALEVRARVRGGGGAAPAPEDRDRELEVALEPRARPRQERLGDVERVVVEEAVRRDQVRPCRAGAVVGQTALQTLFVAHERCLLRTPRRGDTQ